MQTGSADTQAPLPPAALGPAATIWRCRCGNQLGVREGQWLASRHRGRLVLAALPARVQCEACHRLQLCHPVAGPGATT